MRASQPIDVHLPHDLSDTSSAQQNIADYDRVSMDAEIPVIDARKLCILGLPWDTTDTELQTYFAQFGPLESAAIIRKLRTGESRGFGFVTYQAETDAQSVLHQDHSIGGRHIDAKQALPRGNSNPNRETRLFIGKLPADLSDVELRDHFEKFGKVQDAYIPKDAANGKQGHRGFGFVTFANADDVDKVLQCAHTLKGTDVAVQCAVPKDKTLEIQAKSAGIGKIWPPFPLAESYPSSNDSLTTIGVPQQSIYGSIGSGILSHPGPSQWAAAQARMKAPVSNLQDRFSPRDSNNQSDIASTSGRDHLPYTGDQVFPSMERAHIDRISLSNSQGSSIDYPYQRRTAPLDRHVPSTDATAQALQNLTFAPSTQQNLGFSLALLQQAQANENPQQFLGNRFVPHPGLGVNANYPPHNNAARFRRNIPQPFYPNSVLDRLPGSQSGLSFAQRPSPLGNAFGGFQTQAPPTAPTPAFSGFNGTGPPDARAGPRMFVGKLNKDITEQDIKDYMSQFGYVLDVYMPRDKVKRTEHRGFGFVTFETNAAIERVALNAPHRIKGSVVVVDEAAPRREDTGDLGAESPSDFASDIGLNPSQPSVRLGNGAHLGGQIGAIQLGNSNLNSNLTSNLNSNLNSHINSHLGGSQQLGSSLGGGSQIIGSPSQHSNYMTDHYQLNGLGSPSTASIGASPRILQNTSSLSGDLNHQLHPAQHSLDSRGQAHSHFLDNSHLGSGTYNGL